MDFEQIVSAALSLKPLERVRLMEKLMESLESSLTLSADKPHPRDTFYDLLTRIDLPEEDRDEIRRGSWEGFGTASHLNSEAEESES